MKRSTLRPVEQECRILERSNEGAPVGYWAGFGNGAEFSGHCTGK